MAHSPPTHLAIVTFPKKILLHCPPNIFRDFQCPIKSQLPRNPLPELWVTCLLSFLFSRPKESVSPRHCQTPPALCPICHFTNPTSSTQSEWPRLPLHPFLRPQFKHHNLIKLFTGLSAEGSVPPPSPSQE